MGNTRKVSKRIRDAESIKVYMEKMAIWGYLRYTKSSPNARKVFKRIRRIRGKNYAYMEKTQRNSWRLLLIRQEI
jgi:hypothetical protein